MPLEPEPYDKDFMNHPYEPPTPALGFHPDGDTCGVMTELKHSHPSAGPGNRWVCTREPGHIGRHEAGYSRMEDGQKAIIASWAPR